MKKQTFLYNLKQIAIIFCASLATAVAVEIFLLPGDAIIGGALGIASILDICLTGLSASKWYMSVGVWLLAVNVPIFVYCFLRYRRRFAVKTLLYVCFLSAELIIMRVCNLSKLFEGLMYPNPEDTMDRVIYIIIGGALHGVSLPLLLSQNASAGGSDIVGLIVQRHTKKSSSQAMRLILLADAIIIFVSSLALYFVYKDGSAAVRMFVYSIASMFICEIVQEIIFKGFSAAFEMEITTDKKDEMIEALQAELKHGVTMVRITGGYSHQEKTLIICVINKGQLTKARKVINKVDPTAFAYVEPVKEVIGKGFANKEIELEQEDN